MVYVLLLLCGVSVNVLTIHAQETAEEKCQLYNTILKSLEPFIKPTTNVDMPWTNAQYHSEERENPHMAALGFGKNDDSKLKIKWICGGALISEDYILTAAHCVRTRSEGTVQFIRLGSRRLSYDDLGEVFEVETAIVHPDYKTPSQYNDIALIKLRRPMKFSASIFPACLNIAHFDPQPAELESIGWGPEKTGEPLSDALWRTKMQYHTHEKCQEVYGNVSKNLKSGIDDLNQLCAYKTNSDKPCYTFSGSPLQVRKIEKQLPSVVGITSFGKACESETAPGVYTRVSAYIPWIESVVWK